MTRTFFCLCALLLLPLSQARCAWWAENDYVFGSGHTSNDSLSIYAGLSPNVIAGAGASYYRDADHDRRKAYAFRAPLTYSTSTFIATVKPFIYPSSSGTGSRAAGARAYLLLPLQKADQEDNYLNLTLSGAAARQRTPLLSPSGAPQSESFSETAVAAQLEKSYYNQFFFQLSAAGFSRSGTSRDSNPSVRPGPDTINPVLDHADMAETGTFRRITSLPKWTAGAQFARNMAPDYNSYIYAGYSRISFRSTQDANSVLGGIKIGLGASSTLDLAYNYFKINGENGENYYRLLVRVYLNQAGTN